LAAFARAAVDFGTIDQRFAAFSGECLMASVPMCRKIPTLRASSGEAGITLFPRHRCEQPLALDPQDVGHRKSIDGHAAIGAQTGRIIGIFRASGNAGREGEGERLLAPFARPKKDRRYAAYRLRRSRQEGGPEQSPEPSSRERWFSVDQ